MTRENDGKVLKLGEEILTNCDISEEAKEEEPKERDLNEKKPNYSYYSNLFSLIKEATK